MKLSKRIFKEASTVMKLLLIREFMLFQSVLPALRLLLSKTDQHATHFFNACVSPSSCDTWYSDQPLQKDSCEIYVNLRNAKSLILPTVEEPRLFLP